MRTIETDMFADNPTYVIECDSKGCYARVEGETRREAELKANNRRWRTGTEGRPDLCQPCDEKKMEEKR